MAQQLIDFQTAESDLLACATYLTQKIGSSDGHAEAVKEIIPYYLEKGDVDTAAQLADSIVDTFFRDKLLVDVAEKCAEISDDEYALQLADAIEDEGLRSVAFERSAIQKAGKNDFEKAFKYIVNLAHPSDAMTGIAVSQFISGDESSALKTIAEIEVPLSKVNALAEIAEINLRKEETVIALNYLEKAANAAEEIDFAEEKIRALLQISAHFIEVKRKDRAIELLDEARSLAEILPGINRENFLANVSLGFLRAGSVDLADRVLDLVVNKTIMASALTSFAVEFDKNGEREEALETLEEAYAIIKSERDKEIRDSRARFGIMGSIAVCFANFHQPERAVEIALENPYDEERNSALKQIAQISAAFSNDESARQAIEAIEDKPEKIFGLIGVSDAQKKLEKFDEALKFLNDAHHSCTDVRQNFMRSNLYNWLTVKYSALGKKDQAREIAAENLETIFHILDDSHKAIALAHLAKIYDDLEFELNPKEKEVLNKMLRKSEW